MPAAPASSYCIQENRGLNGKTITFQCEENLFYLTDLVYNIIYCKRLQSKYPFSDRLTARGLLSVASTDNKEV